MGNLPLETLSVEVRDVGMKPHIFPACSFGKRMPKVSLQQCTTMKVRRSQIILVVVGWVFAVFSSALFYCRCNDVETCDYV